MHAHKLFQTHLKAFWEWIIAIPPNPDSTMTLPAMNEHEILKYYQDRVLLYLFKYSANLKTRGNPDVPVRMEVHEYFNLRTYNAIKSVCIKENDTETKEENENKFKTITETSVSNPLNALFMTIGLGEYEFVFTDAKNEKHIFEIDYREEHNPKPTNCNMTYFRRLLIRTPTPESFVEFYKLACEIDNTSDQKLRISVTNKYSEWNTYSRIPVRRLNTIYMDERIKQRILDDVTDFLNNEAEYDAFGIPYKKTYLLTGVP